MRPAVVASLLALLVSEPVAQDPQAPPARVERRWVVMGTEFTVDLEASSRRDGLLATEAALAAVQRVDRRLSTWPRDSADPGSELARLNAESYGRPVSVSPELATDLLHVKRWWRATDGALDPTLGRLVFAWGLRSGGRRPGRHELAAALSSGFASVDVGSSWVTRTDSRVILEEGAFGKGVALDAAGKEIQGKVRSAALDLGGQVLLVGRGRWDLALAHPRHRDRPVCVLSAQAGSVATSGSSERGVVVGGSRIGHVLDPRTGRPAADFGSLTIIAPTATAADCLSTGLYVLGPERALAWADERPGYDVIVLQHSDASGLSNGRANRRTAVPHANPARERLAESTELSASSSRQPDARLTRPDDSPPLGQASDRLRILATADLRGRLRSAVAPIEFTAPRAGQRDEAR